MRKVCFLIGTEFGKVQLIQTGFDQFTVTYGRYTKEHLVYAEAAKELGECLMHRAACDGDLDNRTLGEATDAGDTQPVYG